jgi:hypothetical protein
MKTINLKKILLKIEESIYYNTLDYKYRYRFLITNNYFDDLPMINSSFKYLNDNKEFFNKDEHLKLILNMCTQEDLLTNVNSIDTYVIELGHIFNSLIKSTRKIVNCYDCGTTARAIFLSIVKLHRGNLNFSSIELEEMRSNYNIRYDNLISRVNECFLEALNINSNVCFILSISLHKSGHVFILDKKLINNKYRFHLYQSCLASHLLVDYVERMKYADNVSIDIESFFNDLKIILESSLWNEKQKILFAKWFAYLPNHPVNINKKLGFCWTKFIY